MAGFRLNLWRLLSPSNRSMQVRAKTCSRRRLRERFRLPATFANHPDVYPQLIHRERAKTALRNSTGKQGPESYERMIEGAGTFFRSSVLSTNARKAGALCSPVGWSHLRTGAARAMIVCVAGGSTPRVRRADGPSRALSRLVAGLTEPSSRRSEAVAQLPESSEKPKQYQAIMSGMIWSSSFDSLSLIASFFFFIR